MRVVQVNYAFDAALASAEVLLERYTTLTGWAEALAGAGAEVLTVQQFHVSTNVTRGGIPYRFGSFRAIAAAAAAWRPDVVHVNGLGFPARTWALRRQVASASDGHRMPVVVVQNHADGGAIGRAPWLRVAGRLTRRGADAFLFAVPEHAHAWRDAGLVAPDAPVYAVMPASTTLRPMPRDEARSASGVTGDPAVVWIGRLNANKDPLIVLEAFGRFVGMRPGATLTMIFDEEELLGAVRARLASWADPRDRVRLAGAVAHDRIAAFLSAADLFVVGSHHEGSGYALMEALACGATPVVTDIPTFRALVGASQVPATWQAPGWHRSAGCGRRTTPTRARVRSTRPPRRPIVSA